MKSAFERTYLWAALGAIGVVLLAVTAYFAYPAFEFSLGAAKAPGRVVEVIKTHSYRGSRMNYELAVVFRAFDGKDYSFRYKTPFPDRQYQKGMEVPVLYPKDDPGRAVVDEPFNYWFTPGILLFLSLTFMAVGFGMLKFMKIVGEGPRGSSAGGP